MSNVSESLLLGIDVGTSSCKVAFFDFRGNLIAQTFESYPTSYSGLRVEQNPEGLGTIGMFALQWAKVFGAETIFCSDIVPEKLEIAHQLRADYCINSLKQNTSEVIFNKSNEGVDLVVEIVGISATQVQSLELVRPRGRIVYIGTSHGNVRFSLRKL